MTVDVVRLVPHVSIRNFILSRGTTPAPSPSCGSVIWPPRAVTRRRRSGRSGPATAD